jgi:hypothetical protein
MAVVERKIMTTLSIRTPAPVVVPRGALPLAGLFTAALGWFGARRQTLVANAVASDLHTEAAAVREYAHRYASQDPRFAADLLAAADRHEGGM